jgi:hypothetical protein
LGIAGNTYDNTDPRNSLGTALYPNDSYLYSQGDTTGVAGNLVIGTNEPNAVVRIIANGSSATNIVAQFGNGGVSITGIVSATGNILTAGQVSASGNVYGNNIIGNVTSTGNISVTGNITGNNLIANTSVNWQNSGNVAVYQIYNAGTGSLDTIFT